MKHIDSVFVITMIILIMLPKKDGHSTINKIENTDNSIKRLYREVEISEQRLEATILNQKFKEQKRLKYQKYLENKFILLKKQIKKDSI